jgi:UDP-glucose 4-epimerase
LGSHLAEGLLSQNNDVIIFDHFKRGSNNLEKITEQITLITGDFNDERSVADALSDVDYVFHYISSTTPATAIHNPVYDIKSNVIPSVKLLQIAVKSGVKKIIFASSGGTVYGDPERVPVKESFPLNPQTPYAISKVAIERYLNYFYRNYGLDYLTIRYSNPYGERQNPYGNQGVIPIFLNKIKNEEKPTIYGDGNSFRDYIYIKDAIDATLKLMDLHNPDKIFNVGSGKGTSLNELVSIMSQITGKTILPEFVDNSGIYLSKIVLDISKVTRDTGWTPKVSLREGIQKTWEGIRIIS